MRSRIVLTAQILFGFAVSAMLVSSSDADLSYTLKTTTSFPSGQDNPVAQFSLDVSTTYYYATGKERTDASLKSAFFNTTSETITDCAANSIKTIDPDLNIYKVDDSRTLAPDPFGLGAGPGMGGRRRGGASAAAPTTYNGTVTVNFKVTNLPDETVNDVLAHHHKVILTTTTTGTVPETMTGAMTLDIWTDDTARPIGCTTELALNAKNGGVPGTTGVKYVYTGDVTQLGSLLKGVPVRLQFQMPKQPGAASTGMGAMMANATFTMDRIDMSTDALDDDTFGLPSGATKVSDNEFSDQQDAARKARFGGFGGGGGGGGNQ